MASRALLAAVVTALLLLLESSSSQAACTPLATPIRAGLEATLRAQTQQLAAQFNMSFTVGVAMCDGSNIATSAGLDDRFARTPLRS
jgi:hypothetical protein